ncbi:ribosome maturation factor RimM [bacterium]|nr:ribosome maturation factor RimM [bacterium]MBU0900182.1 ribosome maturation factor RimM [bacterium]MBU1153471.1 ribosome maturation factor RimM [bacterium]MBU2599039.1 ribosome maturation factor RimM [bacterium]
MDEEYIAVGEIVGTFGNKGAVKVRSLTDNPHRFEELKEAFLISQDKEISKVKVTAINYRKNQITLNIKGYDNISEAKNLLNQTVAILKKDCPELPEGSFYEFEIIGLNAYDTQDNYLGKVVDIYKTGSNDVYALDNDLLLPAIKEVIKKIDLENKKMTVFLMEGLV